MGARSLEDRYSDVHKLIFSQVKKFYYQFGGDFEELVGQALLIFIVQGKRWNTRRGSQFSTWMMNKIWRGLIDANKKRWRHPEPYIEDLIAEKLWSSPTYSDRGTRFRVELYDRIGEDAQQVVDLILRPKQEVLLKYIFAKTEGKKTERRALRRYLTLYKKWPDKRVDNAFWEIQSAIRS